MVSGGQQQQQQQQASNGEWRPKLPGMGKQQDRQAQPGCLLLFKLRLSRGKQQQQDSSSSSSTQAAVAAVSNSSICQQSPAAGSCSRQCIAGSRHSTDWSPPPSPPPKPTSHGGPFDQPFCLQEWKHAAAECCCCMLLLNAAAVCCCCTLLLTCPGLHPLVAPLSCRCCCCGGGGLDGGPDASNTPTLLTPYCCCCCCCRWFFDQLSSYKVKVMLAEPKTKRPRTDLAAAMGLFGPVGAVAGHLPPVGLDAAG
jgi:hypothetical protein